MGGEPLTVVRVSAASMRQKFNGCDPDYIATTCHAACCKTSTHPSGVRIVIHPSEQAAIEARGGVVVGGMLEPREGERHCRFESDGSHLCELHFTPDKPFNCSASPFTLAPGGRTLVVKNRFRRLRCFNDGKMLPAYVAFRAALELLFGAEPAWLICAHLEAGGGDLFVEMSDRVRAMLLDNATSHHAPPE